MRSGGKNLAEKGFFAKILNGELPEAPISKLLGWKYLEFNPSTQVLKVEMQARPDFVNPAGFIHGGMLQPCWTKHYRRRWP
jgi:acyl-coenzyme A thioesterase PaaI-like protein